METTCLRSLLPSFGTSPHPSPPLLTLQERPSSPIEVIVKAFLLSRGHPMASPSPLLASPPGRRGTHTRMRAHNLGRERRSASSAEQRLSRRSASGSKPNQGQHCPHFSSHN